VSSTHASWLGWQSVTGSVVDALLLLLYGILVLRGTGRLA
jgi:hypothetical protein